MIKVITHPNTIAMKILSKIKKTINRSFRILKIVRWKRRKARLAFEAWLNDEEYVSVGSRAH